MSSFLVLDLPRPETDVLNLGRSPDSENPISFCSWWRQDMPPKWAAIKKSRERDAVGKPFFHPVCSAFTEHHTGAATVLEWRSVAVGPSVHHVILRARQIIIDFFFFFLF